jgi:2-amino-4-hydroxy-6-hydroxymethyldihydropteridine diphosphokinase
MVSCYVALGSNLGNRQKNITLALKSLRLDPAIKIVKVSSLIETKAIGGPSQPGFLNGVVKLKTDYSAQELLRKLQEIEVKLGRKPPHLKNHPRTIDLDILLYGDLSIEKDNLKIPHPRMWQREFVTVPLKEIAPELFKKRNYANHFRY